MILVSLGYSQGFPRQGTPNDSGVLENGDAHNYQFVTAHYH